MRLTISLMAFSFFTTFTSMQTFASTEGACYAVKGSFHPVTALIINEDPSVICIQKLPNTEIFAFDLYDHTSRNRIAFFLSVLKSSSRCMNCLNSDYETSSLYAGDTLNQFPYSTTILVTGTLTEDPKQILNGSIDIGGSKFEILRRLD